jgi:hypothetical protein
MVENLEDLFSTPRIRDDQTLSTEGVEEFFALQGDDVLEDSLTLDAVEQPSNPVETESPVADDSIDDLFLPLFDELTTLADDIQK